MATRDSAPPAAPHSADEQQARRNLPVPASAPAVPIAAGETSSSAIAAREKAAIEARFLYAMANRRSFADAFQRLRHACQRPRFAEVARYAKPVGNEKVYGLSVRFAEEARILWGNIDVSAMLVFDDDERRIYRVVGTDLETNATDAVDVMVEKFVERRFVRDGMEVVGQRVNKQGQPVYRIRATEDDLAVKANNFIAKARRNVILSVIPADVKEECEEIIVQTISDRDKKDPDAARKQVVDLFFKQGVMAKQIEDLLGHPIEQITLAELTLLRSYYTALKEGESTWPDIFEAHTRLAATGNGEQATTTGPARGTDALRDNLKGKAANGGEKKAEPQKAEAPKPEAPKAEGTKEAGTAEEICAECGQKGGRHIASCWYALHRE